MTIKSLKELTREHIRKRKERQKHFWKAFIYNPAFEEYRQKTFNQVRRNTAWLKKYEAEINLPGPRRDPYDYDPEKHVLYNFLQTPEGEALARRLNLYPPARLPVWPQKLKGYILTLEINLAYSKKEISSALYFELFRNRRRALDKARVRKSQPGLPVINQKQEDREKGNFLILDVDLQHTLEEMWAAVEPLLPRGQPTGPQLKLKLKVDPWKAWEAVRQERSFRKASWRLGVRESTLKEAYYRAFGEIMGRTYNPLTDHPAKTPPPKVDCRRCRRRPTCKKLCPPMAAMLKREEISCREKLLSAPHQD